MDLSTSDINQHHCSILHQSSQVLHIVFPLISYSCANNSLGRGFGLLNFSMMFILCPLLRCLPLPFLDIKKGKKMYGREQELEMQSRMHSQGG